MEFTQETLDRHFLNNGVGGLCISIPIYNRTTRTVENKIEPIDSLQEGYIKIAQALAAEAARTSDTNTRPTTFTELLKKYNAQKTPLPKWYSECLLSFFGSYHLTKISPELLQAFRAYRAATTHRYTGKPRKEASINREMEALRRVLNFGYKRGWLSQNNFLMSPELLIRKSEEKSRTRMLSDEEEARLLAGCDDPARAHLRPLIIGLLDTGLRKGKLLSLRVRQIDLENRIIDLGEPKSRNKRHPRFHGITERFAAELSALITEADLQPDDLVFGIRDFRRAFGTLCRKAGIADLHIHDLRHRYATDGIRAAIPKSMMMKATGHSDEETFDVYLNLDKEMMREITTRIDQHRRARRRGSVHTAQPANDQNATPTWI